MDIKKLLELAKITPKPEWDQFFLQDDEMLEREVKLANLKQKDVVLEIGAGIGNLTVYLAKRAPVIAVESDYAFARVLKGIGNVSLVLGDAIEFLESLRGGAPKRAGGIQKRQFNKIVSNIPYLISQKIVVELLHHKWSVAVLCVQKEFAEKLFAKDKLGMLLQDCCDVRIAAQVPADAFYPTAVPSAVVVLKQKKQMDEEFWKFLQIVYRKRNQNAEKFVRSTKFSQRKINSLTYKEIRSIFGEFKSQKYRNP